jgi:hypothetical protein
VTPLPTRSRLALYLDLWLLVALLLLFSPRLTGLPIHEWLGIALALSVVLHLLLSWSWISAATRAFVTGAKPRSRINFALNWLLFVLITLEITSGLMISAAALPAAGIHTVNDRSWRALHNLALNWTLLVLGFHVAMNWHPLLLGVRRHFRLLRLQDE